MRSLGVCSLLVFYWLLVIEHWSFAEGVGCLAWFCSRSSGVRDRRTPDYATRQLVAREGIAPPTSLCRRDMILFHHRAELGCGRRIRTINCAFKERRVARYSIPQ